MSLACTQDSHGRAPIMSRDKGGVMNKRSGSRMRQMTLLSAVLFCGAMAPVAAAPVPNCPPQYEHPTSGKTPSAVRSKAISYVLRVETLDVRAVSPRADLLKAPWWTVGTHKCKWQGRIEITYGGQLPVSVAVGYRVLVNTKTPMRSGGDALWLTIARVGDAWKVLAAGTSP